MWKTKRINMTARSAADEEFRYTGFGGRGIVAKTLTDEVDPACDPLGPDNKLIFACTALAGTGLTSSARLSVGGKSPLTLGIKEANAGGQFAAYLANQGYMEIIVEGQAKDGLYTIVMRKDGSIDFEDASMLRGLTTYAVGEKLIEKYGKNIGYAVIGPAGERGYRIASIQVNELGNNYPCRAAARGGLGAVMGSRGIKAIVIEKAESNYKPEFASPETVKEKRKFLNNVVASAPTDFPLKRVGTPDGTGHAVSIGKCPIKNFSGQVYDGIENLYSEKYMEVIGERGSIGHSCMPGCALACSGICNDEKGNHLTAGFEYETVATCGPNCGMTDINVVMKMDRMCDEAGIDTVEAGVITGIAMEGGLLEWGDGEGTLDLLQQITDGTELGNIAGAGAESMAAHLGVTRVPVARHQSMPGFEPRACVPTGVAFAMGNMGADHTIAPAEGTFEGEPIETIMGVYKQTEMVFGVVDNLCCMMNFIFLGEHLPVLAEFYAAVYGGPGTPDQLFALAGETLALEKTWNERAGWKKEDNILPQFFFDEPLPITGTKFPVPKEVLTS